MKASTPEALAALKAEGVRVVMLTGDNWTTAKAVARRLGIDEVEAEVLPEQKSEVVQKHKAAGQVVAMAGDGVNDAPALAAADVGIAMGTGTDVAMESAGVTLLKGDLTGIVRARRLSQATMRNIRQNLFFAFIYNAARRSDCGRRSLPVLRNPAVADHRGRGDGALVGQRGRQCAAIAARAAATCAKRAESHRDHTRERAKIPADPALAQGAAATFMRLITRSRTRDDNSGLKIEAAG